MDIATIRKNADLTQVEMAALLGCHPMTISKWERGIGEPQALQQDIYRILEGAYERGTALHFHKATQLAKGGCRMEALAAFMRSYGIIT